MNAVTTETEPRTNVRTPEEAPGPEPEKAPGRRRGLKRGLLLGLITGFAGGTLFAPEAGEELRRRVRAEAEALLAHPEELPSRLRERIAAQAHDTGTQPEPSGPAEWVRSLAAAARDRVREAIEQGRRASREAQERLRDEYRRMTHRGA